MELNGYRTAEVTVKSGPLDLTSASVLNAVWLLTADRWSNQLDAVGGAVWEYAAQSAVLVVGRSANAGYDAHPGVLNLLDVAIAAVAVVPGATDTVDIEHAK